jgi:hypothetical protein
VDELCRGARAQSGRETRCGGVDAVDACEYLPALSGELRTDRRELLAANDARAERLAVEPFHEESFAKAIALLEHVEDLGLGDAGDAGGAEELRLHGQTGAESVGSPRHDARRAAHGEPPFAADGVDHETVRLLARAAGEPLARSKRAESHHALAENPREAMLEIGGRIARHQPPPPAASPLIPPRRLWARVAS